MTSLFASTMRAWDRLQDPGAANTADEIAELREEVKNLCKLLKTHLEEHHKEGT